MLNELKVLSSPETSEIQTIYTDSDIYSMREAFFSPSNNEQHAQNDEGQSKEQTAFHALDSSNGIVRHATFIESRFYALFITSDNVNTLLQSTQEKVVAYFSRQVLGQLRGKPLLLESKHLAAIENQWTGATRISSHYNLTQSEFYSVITFVSYMTVAWEQVRELCIIAVAKDAFDALVVGSNLQQGRGNTRPPETQDIDNKLVFAAISQLKHGFVRHNLLAAISRVALRFDSLSFSEFKNPILSVDDATTWELVHYIYKAFKKGRLEPTEPFLRFSKRTDSQRLDSSDEVAFNFDEDLSVSASMAVLIHGGGHAYDLKKTQQSSLCVYLVGESQEAPNKVDLAAIIKETFENCDVYHTTRDNGRLNIKASKGSKAPWNLEKTYGVHFSYGRQSFPKWLRSLDANLPTRQGSLRHNSSSGCYMFDREYSPWHDHRLIYGGPYGRMREKFLQMLIASEFGFWRKVAQNRYEEGVQCCACCAEILEEGEESDEEFCSYCLQEQDFPKYARRFGDELRKGLINRIQCKRGDRSLMESPTEYTITTPEISPFRASLEDISGPSSSEDGRTDDLSDGCDEADNFRDLDLLGNSGNRPMASLQSAFESSRQMTAVSPSKKRKRFRDEAA